MGSGISKKKKKDKVKNSLNKLSKLLTKYVYNFSLSSIFNQMIRQINLRMITMKIQMMQQILQ